MPRPLVLSNGRLYVALDRDLNLRDLTWPHVGLLNHLSGAHVRLGIWTERHFSWLSDSSWNKTLAYRPETLVTDVTAQSDQMQLTLRLSDTVLHDKDVLLRHFTLINHAPFDQTIRLYQAQNFSLAETDIGDTAFYNPFLDAVIHYKRDIYLLVTGRHGDHGVHQYACGIKGFGGAEGTWRDAEDGHLSLNAVAQGSVDSVFSLEVTVPAHGTAEADLWICAGKNLDEVAELHESLQLHDRSESVEATARHWHQWSSRETESLNDLPEDVRNTFRRSLLMMRTNIDHAGAIIAANDSDIMETARAHYSYMWPRDGALVSAALDLAGCREETEAFFRFCQRALPPGRGVLMHKYGPDGSWGSTWHPWIIDGHAEVPFQEDSTALVLWALWEHYMQFHDMKFCEDLYESFVVPCADYVAAYRSPDTGLPEPSWDLWEERRGVHAYTCGTVFGALDGASKLAGIMDDKKRATKWRKAALEVRKGILKHLWSEEHGRFARRIILHPGSTSYELDTTIDSAVHALHAFGALPADDPYMERSMRATISRLWVRTDIGGMARYENDYYFRQSDDIENVPGNPWFICTLWAAQWYIARATEKQELATALELIQWCVNRAMSSGALPEQLHAYTGEPLSVAPLTWSHAEFVSTVMQYVQRQKELSM